MTMPPVEPVHAALARHQVVCSPAHLSQARDRKPMPATSTSTGKRVDEATLKLAEWLTVNTGVQDRLASAIQDGYFVRDFSIMHLYYSHT